MFRPKLSAIYDFSSTNVIFMYDNVIYWYEPTVEDVLKRICKLMRYIRIFQKVFVNLHI